MGEECIHSRQRAVIDRLSAELDAIVEMMAARVGRAEDLLRRWVQANEDGWYGDALAVEARKLLGIPPKE